MTLFAFRRVITRVSNVTRICFVFALVTALSDWPKNLAPLSHPIRGKTNRDSLVHGSRDSRRLTCNYFEHVLIGSLDFLCPL